MARLATFSHPLYCRVRRVQPAADSGRGPALVSTHVAGRRLAEILDTSVRAAIRPPIPAVMATARQTMASVALLHDYSPDAFHGAIGPDRLILAGERRIVVAEHVLGTVMTQAVQAWGPDRVWRELGVATMTDPALAQDGRRNDIVQLGLLVLALLLGRLIAPHEFPDELSWLLQQATETGTDGERAPLGPKLRDWLERTLSLAGDRSYATLVDSQDALTALWRDERYAPSPAAWGAFVAACEAARASLPTAPSAGEPPADRAEAKVETSTKLQFMAEFGPSNASDSLAAWLAEPAEPPAVMRGGTPAAMPIDLPKAAAPATAGPPPGVRIETGLVPASLPRAGRNIEDPVPPADDEAEAWPAWSVPEEADRPQRRRRWNIELRAFVRPTIVLALLVAVGAAAAVYAPRVWAVIFDEQRTSGQLAVISDPDGSSVTIDGLFHGLTPIVVTLREGGHQLEVQNGGALQTRAVQIHAGQRTAERLVFPGIQDRGGLSISTYPATGRVMVDGVTRGQAPVKIAGLTPGLHVVVVETSMGSQSQDVMVEAGKLLPVQVQTVSWVKVGAPYDLEVSEEGRKLGTTGRAAVALSPGHHHLEFINSSLGLKLRQVVDAQPGQLTTVPLDLPMGTLNVTTDVPADVSVDGQFVGGTPLSGLAVPLGRHEIVLQNQRYGRLVYNEMATLAGPVLLNASFKK